MVIVIRRTRTWLWRALGNEGEVLDFLVRRRCPAKAARRLMKTLLETQGFAPSRVVADKLRSYPSASRAMGLAAEHDRGLRANDRARDFASTGSPARYPNYKGSPHPAPRNVSSPSTPQPTTPSTTSVTSSNDRCSRNFEPHRSRFGKPRASRPDLGSAAGCKRRTAAARFCSIVDA